MPEGYRVYKSGDFIRKTAEGQLDLQKSLDLVKELVTASGFHREHDVLIDLRQTEPLENFVDLLIIAIEFAAYQDAFHNKIAMIITNTPDRIKRADFFMANLGEMKFSIDYFTDFEDAIDWLSTIQKFPEDS